jgi:lipoprotein-anchoring transpeptidase ErfK/SrfK
MARRVLFLLQVMLLVISAWLPAAAAPPQPGELYGARQARIVIKTSAFKLYFFDANNNVRTFSIAVGRDGRKWSGETTVSRKVLRPKWAPPPAVRRDNPKLPAIVLPGPNNPLGAAVLVLGDGTYGIHGNNDSSKIGTNASYGCFRMYNKDILYLYKQVRIGTRVTVLP